MANIDPNRLCPKCMTEKSSADMNCPFCGCDPSVLECSPRCIRAMTVLAGKYLVGSVLGEGGFGITYIGWNLHEQTRVAIKEYFPSALAVRDTASGANNTVHSISGEKRAHFANGLSKFEDEARNLLRFKGHDGIVAFKDFFFENETAYIVMEYLDGCNLRDYLTKVGGRLSEAETLKILKPVILSLGKVHAEGIIHRDISPDNIMVLRGGAAKLKVIDFGAARISSGEETQSLTVILKPGYAPKEQYIRRGRQGPCTDVYAMCAVIYKLLSGKTPEDSMARVMEDELTPLSGLGLGVSARTSAAVEKGMSINAENRFQSMDELYNALYPEQKLSRTELLPPTKPKRKPRLTTRFWVITGVCCAAAALIILCATLINRAPLGTPPSLPSAMERTTEPEPETEPEPVTKPEPAAEPKPAVQPEQSEFLWTENNGSVTVTGMDAQKDILNIPETINGMTVTAIGDYAFYEWKNLKQVKLPASLTEIGEGAFTGCDRVTVYVPDGSYAQSYFAEGSVTYEIAGGE